MTPNQSPNPAAVERLRVVALENEPIVIAGMMADFRMGNIDAWATGDESEIMSHVATKKPHVVVVDLKMDQNAVESRGLTYLRLVKERWPGIKRVVFTSFRIPTDFRRAIAESVDSYVVKDGAMDSADMVRRVASGANILDPALMKSLTSHIVDAHQQPLTRSELQILQLLATTPGITNQQLGEQVRRSPDTIKTHLRSIFAKLGVDDRDDAVLVARIKGILR